MLSFLITATLNYEAARAQEELHEQNLLELEAEELGGGERTVPAGDGAGGAMCAAPCAGLGARGGQNTHLRGSVAVPQLACSPSRQGLTTH